MNKKQEIIKYYKNKKNWVLTPPSLSVIGKKFGVVKSYVHKVIHEKDNLSKVI